LLATSEAFANAVEHPQKPSFHLIDIAGSITNRTISVSVRDYGTWQSEQAARSEGGMGLPIMDLLMDSVCVQRLSDGTTVTLRRRLAMR